MEASKPLKKKGKVSSNNECIICSCDMEEVAKKDRPSQLPSTDPKVLFHRFCEKFLPTGVVGDQKQDKHKWLLWKGLSACSKCGENMCMVLDTRSKMELVEGRVRKLQEEVVQELKELKLYVDLLTWQLGKIQRSVREDSGGGSLEGDRRSSGGRRRLPGERAGTGLLRDYIANVATDLQLYQNGLKQKVECDVFGTTCSTAGRGRTCGGAGIPVSNRLPKKESTNQRYQMDRDSSGSEDSNSGSDYLPSASESTPPGSPLPPTDNIDGNLSTPIKLEPTSEAEDCEKEDYDEKEQPEPNGFNLNLPDYVESEEEEFRKFELCETSGQVLKRKRPPGRPRIKRIRKLPNETSGNRNQVWEKIDISEQQLKEDFRVFKNNKLKGCKETVHYCAHSLGNHQCPVRVKVKEYFATGIKMFLRNEPEHRNHRTAPIGLTKEQKEFVGGCLKLGNNKPTEILLAFSHQGLEGPCIQKLRGYLGRVHGNIKKNKAIIPEGEQGPPQAQEVVDNEAEPSCEVTG